MGEGILVRRGGGKIQNNIWSKNRPYYQIEVEEVAQNRLPYGVVGPNHAVFLNGCIHLVGSDSSTKTSDGRDNYTQHYKLDSDGDWIKLNQTPYITKFSTAVVFKNELYLLGGGYSAGYYTEFYKYNESNDSWTSLSKLPFNCYRAQAIEYNGKLHVFGSGYSGLYCIHYSWDGSKWTKETDVPSDIGYLSSYFVLNDILYLAYDTTCYYYTESGWLITPNSLPESYESSPACVLAGKVYLIGSSNYNKVLAWDGTGTWETVLTVSRLISHSSAVATDDGIYCMGGNGDAYYTKSSLLVRNDLYVDFLNYISNNNPEAFPNDGMHKDGYYYRKFDGRGKYAWAKYRPQFASEDIELRTIHYYPKGSKADCRGTKVYFSQSYIQNANGTYTLDNPSETVLNAGQSVSLEIGYFYAFDSPINANKIYARATTDYSVSVLVSSSSPYYLYFSGSSSASIVIKNRGVMTGKHLGFATSYNKDDYTNDSVIDNELYRLLDGFDCTSMGFSKFESGVCKPDSDSNSATIQVYHNLGEPAKMMILISNSPSPETDKGITFGVWLYDGEGYYSAAYFYGKSKHSQCFYSSRDLNKDYCYAEASSNGGTSSSTQVRFRPDTTYKWYVFA